MVTLAPSGRPLAAFANGSILFTSKLSGVPDLLLTLSAPGGKHTISNLFELPVFHPCVRLARWKEKPGELSFVPPDGKFLLAGYEVNLLPASNFSTQSTNSLNLPVTIEISRSLGPSGSDFEVRLILSSTFAVVPTSSNAARGGLSGRSSGITTPSLFGGNSSSAGPILRDVVATIPIPSSVRNITDIRASRGEAHYAPVEHEVEWRLSTKDVSAVGCATLRCTVVGECGAERRDDETGLGFDGSSGEYNENQDAYQASALHSPVAKHLSMTDEQRDLAMTAQNAKYMPSSASASFTVKSWLASGIKVEALSIDARKSRGLSESVKPLKGAKYLTVSKKGVETRC